MENKLITFVNKSPQAVAIHDKQAWISIFAKYYIVEDPIGASPHCGGLYDAVSGERGNASIDRFYETFIAPNKILFEVAQDIVCGQHVVRDLTVHIQMSDSLKASVPMHLLYELVEENGKEDWKIQRLAAHWELMPMMGQIFGKGLACAPVLFALTVRMFKYQKSSGILGFCKAAFTIGNHGKTSVENFVAAVNNHNLKAMEELFCNPLAEDSLYVSEKKTVLAEWLNQDIKILQFNKMLVAGNFVSVSMHLSINNTQKNGVAFFEFNNINKKIHTLKVYL